MTWEELMDKIINYAENLSKEDLKRLEKELGIVEYITPFGTLRVKTLKKEIK